MFDDFLYSILPISLWSITHQPHDKILGFSTYFGFLREGKMSLKSKNLLTCGWGIVGIEGRITDQHFKHYNSDTPPIYRVIIALLSKYFWSYVIWGSYSRKGQLPSLVGMFSFLLGSNIYNQIVLVHLNILNIENLEYWMLAESKIRQFQMSFIIEENIVRFKIPMNKVHAMYWIDRQNKLSHVKFSFLLRNNVLLH